MLDKPFLTLYNLYKIWIYSEQTRQLVNTQINVWRQVAELSQQAMYQDGHYLRIVGFFIAGRHMKQSVGFGLVN